MAILRTTTRGMTLIELILCISIISIITSVAIPNFQTFIERSKIKTTSNDLRMVLSLARQTAISTGVDTYVCELQSNSSCNSHRPFGANWSYGWLAYIDVNQNAELDETDTIIRVHRTSNQSNIGVIFNQRGRLRFRANGSARSAGFYLCNAKEATHILLLYTGRTRVKTLSDSSRIQQCLTAIK